ncbi:DUF2785 domain-containing protein [Henriciella algicola]|uniref:DUF2785 domain-containing protein n=2 Tax=Henriciella algicola TaxID=1608422 RepID=A0A399RHB8_9PROT|nr:DUF2785 domain-containing protein [Henriciella algicola]
MRPAARMMPAGSRSWGRGMASSLFRKLALIIGVSVSFLAAQAVAEEATVPQNQAAAAEEPAESVEAEDRSPVMSSLSAWMDRPKLFLPDDYPDRTRILRGDVDPYDVFWEVPESWAVRSGMYAEYDTLEAYGRMREAAARDGVHLVILSAFRSFRHQRFIWENKWQDRYERLAGVSPRDIALNIMRYSAMPGTSRHHWGTDLDLNAFNNAYFDTPEGKPVYDWLKAHAGEYGFCEVYSPRASGRQIGYEPERWHWSYIPTASRYLAAYVEAAEAAPHGFAGDEAVPEIDWLSEFVLGIDPECLWDPEQEGKGRALPAPLILSSMDAPADEAVATDRPLLEAGQCIPEGWTHDILLRWKESGYPLTEGEGAAGYLAMLEHCLADPNPDIRDGIAYEGITDILRSDRAEEAELRELKQRLLTRLANTENDPLGFSRPFAALALAEVARTDRIEAWMSQGERRTLLAAGADYTANVRDYRGFIEGEGWRHGVAHGADLLMQLSLNPEIGEGEAFMIAKAVFDAIGSREAPVFVSEEPQRLARPILFLVQRGLLTEEQIAIWMEVLADPAPHESWEEALADGEAKARRENIRAFAAILLETAEGKEEADLDAVVTGAEHLLDRVP